MAGTIAPFPKHQFFDNNGDPASGYKLFTYAAGTSTKQNTYSDFALTSPNTNPVVMDASGRCTLFLGPNLSYKFVFTTPTDTDPPGSPIWTVDGVTTVPASAANIDVDGTAGETLATNDVVYLSDGSGGLTAGRWYKADQDASYASGLANGLGMVSAGIASGSAGTVRLDGRITGLSGLTAGTVYYASATPGALTSTLPLAPAYTAPVGVADSTTSLILMARSKWLSLAQAQTFVGNNNVAINGDLINWAAGPSLAPFGFVLAGAAATVARTGPGEGDTTTLGTGRYAALLTRAGTNATFTQTVISSTEAADNSSIGDGLRFSVAFVVKSSVANLARITIDDGVTTTSSSGNAGGGNPEVLSVTHTISNAFTKLDFRVELNGTNGGAYVGGFVAVFGDIPPIDWSPFTYYQNRLLEGPRISSNINTVGNVGAGTDDLMSYSLSPNMLNSDGKAIRVTGWGDLANNGNAKTLSFVFGATSTTLLSAVTTANVGWRFEVIVARTGAATQKVNAFGAQSGVAPTVVNASPTETLATGNLTVKFTALSGASATDDVRQFGMIVELI